MRCHFVTGSVCQGRSQDLVTLRTLPQPYGCTVCIVSLMTTFEAPSPEGAQLPQRRPLPWPVWVGIGVALIAAAVGSWAALHFLAASTGWVWWSPHLLPASVDIGGVSAGWVWLRADVTPHAREYAKRLTFGAAALSLAGNAVGHLVAEGVLDGGSWPLIVAVGAVPAVMLVALVHMAALVTESPHAATSPPAVDPQPIPSSTAENPQVIEVAPSPPAPKTTRTDTVKPSARGNRQAIVLDILATSTTPDEVPQPATIRETWGVSQATAERARAEALNTLNTTRQEA